MINILNYAAGILIYIILAVAAVPVVVAVVLLAIFLGPILIATFLALAIWEALTNKRQK